MKSHDVLGLAGELLAQLRILRRDADRARVEVALAHHDAADGDERRGREAELLGAEQRRERDVAPGLELAVDLEHDAAAQVVHHEHLLRLGETELPRHAGVLDGRERRRAGAAVVAADEDDVGVRLGDAGRDGADAGLGHELHADARARVDVLEIEDELREILDRVDVVVRRRRDERHARRRVADLGDDRVDLVAGELPAFAGLRALRHLDLQLVGVDQVFGGHAEARRRDLLDRRCGGDRRWRRGVKRSGSSPPSPVLRPAADAVHRDGEVLVRLLGDAAEAHRAGGEALDDLRRRLDLVERHRRARRDEVPQAAQRDAAARSASLMSAAYSS